ncbi:glycosyltransferase family 4 protein [Lysinibacillus sp. SGAir0095]|uniref:glycosyltransferase family 4 protein n=1 Tax=Lysinibacillus sp. SGAir0095 TaxID=2070463 RepID=UPI0010CD43DD|nr:glycosyltransferase family 4 protein [Lysinibacillus sp. SGAir0095]QCR31887.1 glycosyltransferase [Lysinibacillus sp. SGAir0095]
MRIVFLRSNPVQPDPRVEKEVNSLIMAGHEVSVVAWDRSGKYKVNKSFLDLKNGKVAIYRFGIPSDYGAGIKGNIGPLILFQYRLIQWLLKNRGYYDVIHACDFDTAFVSGYLAKLLKKKIIYDIFDYYVDAFNVPKLLKNFIENRDHRLINTVDGVIICSEKRKEQINGTSPKRLAIIHNSPSTSSLKISSLNLNKEKVKIAYIGILAEGRLLKELSEVIINNPDLELHIGGFGTLHEYFQKLSFIHSNIIFYGRLDYSKTLELEKSCDIVTAIYDPKVRNHYFAAPNKFYEALMLGKPIIMVKNTGMDEVVIDNKIGEVIEYNSISLEKAIKNIKKNKTDWPEISIRMKQLYKNNYIWNEMERRLIELYESI